MNEINNSTRVFATMGSNSKQIKVYDVIELTSTIGHTFCKRLPFFYAFTGCDMVCTTAVKLIFGMNYSNSRIFLNCWRYLQHVDIVEKFLVKVYYSKKVNTNSWTDERAAHFKRQASVNIRQLPLSRPGLIEHIKLACIQGGWLWGECIANVQIPDVTEWGWQHGNEDEYVPRWQTVDETFTIDNVTQTCSCRKATCKSCKCAKSGLACLPFCGCEKSCENWFVIHYYIVSFLFVMSCDFSLLLMLCSLLIAAHFTFAWLFW